MKKTFPFLFLVAFMVLQLDVSYASFGKKTKSEESSGSAILVMAPTDDAVGSALTDFKHLSKKEKKERFKEVKKELNNYKEAKKAGAEPSTNTVLLAILAILLPPLAVFLHQGELNSKFWISLLLTLLLWLPGVIYALLVIFGNA